MPVHVAEVQFVRELDVDGTIKNLSFISIIWNCQLSVMHLKFSVNQQKTYMFKLRLIIPAQCLTSTKCVGYDLKSVIAQQKEIWKWCINRSIWLSASHIPGIKNENDFESRNFKDNVELKLNSRIFHTITKIWGHPDVDMFASRLNKQVDRFVSWHPDPDLYSS